MANSIIRPESGSALPSGLEFPPLPAHLQSDKSFLSAYARTLAAIAIADKSVSLADFAALTDVARNSQFSALMGMLIFHALEQGVELDKALLDLSRAQAQSSSQECAAALQMALPLLQGQGHAARPMAKRLAQALKVELAAVDLARLPAEDDTGLLGQLGARARRLIKSEDVTDRVSAFGRNIGDPDIIKSARACQSGSLSRQVLAQQFDQVAGRIEADIVEYRNRAVSLAPDSATNAAASANSATGALLGATLDSMHNMAQQLQQQVQQRLAIVRGRIAYERQTFQEDIDDLVHDAGNAIETAIANRLQTDTWKDKDVWASIGQTQFGQEAERRIGRAVRRREEVLRLFKEELKLFQQDMQVVQASILAKQHHAELAKLMPPLRLGTRVVNAVDSAANLTLGAGTIAVAGTGAAAYLLGSAVVLPIVAPVAPFLVGAMAAAGLFKWFTDSDKRKIDEIQSKRRAIEDVVRKRLSEAAESFDSQLIQLESEYQQTAIAMLGPVLLELEAAGQVQGMHQRIGNRIIEQSEMALQRLRAELR
ncbi:MAG: hypothetical protein RL748_3235 [Pseudomonadota bacterium]